MRCEVCRCLLPVVRISNDNIIDITCEMLNVKKSSLISNDRFQKLVDARNMISHIMYYNPYKEESITLNQIGKLLGNRHHTTILHGIKCVENWFETDNSFKQRFMDLHIKIFGTLDNLNLIKNDTRTTAGNYKPLQERN